MGGEGPGTHPLPRKFWAGLVLNPLGQGFKEPYRKA